MPIKTWLTETIGIEVPVVQGGLQWVGVAELTSAVANAGGLGFLTALTQPTPEDLRKEIAKCRSMTNKPFGVNITMLPAITPPDYAGYARICVEEGITVVETAGDPKPILKYLKDNGIIVFHKCVALVHALRAEALGVDCISIDGIECAGHGGEYDLTSLTLLSLCAQRLKIPYLASGGFFDGRGLATAITLGASGINMGTRWICTVESRIHQKIKEEIIKKDENSTMLIMRKFRNSTRVVKNEISLEVARIEATKANVQFEDVRDLVAGKRGRTVWEHGDPDAGIWGVGQCVGGITDIPTCKELVVRIERDAEKILVAGAAKVTATARL